MSNPKDGRRGRTKETKKCLYRGDIMQESYVPGCLVDAKGFVYSKCGFSRVYSLSPIAVGFGYRTTGIATTPDRAGSYVRMW
nr:hypothetical protein [Thermoproteota archaeon]